VFGLPPEANVWRQDAFTPVEECLVLLIERQELWCRALLDVHLEKREIRVPGELRIPRPGSEPEKPKRVETDPKVIAAWFAATG
jgi:hypothetical protein